MMLAEPAPNPHFLFNAVMTIAYLIDDGCAIDLVESCLHIERARFEDRLDSHLTPSWTPGPN